MWRIGLEFQCWFGALVVIDSFDKMRMCTDKESLSGVYVWIESRS